MIGQDNSFLRIYPKRWMAIKLIEKDLNVLQKIDSHCNAEMIREKSKECIKRIEAHFGRDSEIVVSEQRYAYVHGAVTEAVQKIERGGFQISEWIDKVLLNRIFGLPIFLFILWGIFQATFKIGEVPMGWMEALFSFLSEKASLAIPAGFFHSLVVEGIIGGVGGVFSFVPLIIILFLFLSILEDTGYMARAAFIMDKFLHIFGLHGQSFMPMILGFGCSVPAIMASRTLKSPKDRIMTVLITPFMSCGAKLPVYVLLAGAFFANNAGNVVMSIYLVGVVLALLSSILLRSTIFKGEETPFVMELPPYRMPTFVGISWHVFEKTWMYLKKAGTVILAASIIIWVITTFPILKEDPLKYEGLAKNYKIENAGSKIFETDIKKYVDAAKAEDKMEHSIAGRAGKFIEPVIRPIGFDWKIGISAITGFAAKEVVVSTLGVLYRIGTGEDEESESLRDAIRKDKAFNPLVAYNLMLFILIVAPCFAAQSMMGSEIGWRWVGFHFIYTFVLAWLLCFTVYKVGIAFGLGV